MRLTLSASFALLLAAATSLRAQEACSIAAQQRDAKAVAQVRANLRSIKLPEDDIGTDISAPLQENVTILKSALAQTARDVLACQSTSVSPAALEEELAKLLDANPPQPPPNTTVMNGDKRYEEWLAFEYGRNLLVNVRNLASNLLAITFTFHIPCGDDDMLMVFENHQGQWHDRLLWQSPPYKDINGAFGDLFLNALLPGNTPDDWRLVVAHGKPWCTSRFSGFSIDVLAPNPNDPHPQILWHTDRTYSRSDFTPTLKASGDVFELRVHADEMSFDIETAFERTVIYRYRVSDNHVARLQPIATSGRGFVEEWLSMPWPEAKDQTLPANADKVQPIHRLYESSYTKSTNSYIAWTSGPVQSCFSPGRFQVTFTAQLNKSVPRQPGGEKDEPVSYYFQIKQIVNGYELESASETLDPTCTSRDLMAKPAVKAH
jgi:hypothetical protein